MVFSFFFSVVMSAQVAVNQPLFVVFSWLLVFGSCCFCQCSDLNCCGLFFFGFSS